jgi:hypothetical protein
MRCAKCGGENPEEAAYCAFCGAAMGVSPTAAPSPGLWRVVRLIGGGLLMLLGGLILLTHAVGLATGELTSTDMGELPLTIAWSSMMVTGGWAIVRRLSGLSSVWRQVFAIQAAALALVGSCRAGWALLAQWLHMSGPDPYPELAYALVCFALAGLSAFVAIRAGRLQRC